MAIGTGSDAAIGAADLTLVSGDPTSIADAMLLSRATLHTIHANLTWAFGYNVIAIPLAALGYLKPAVRRPGDGRELAGRGRQQPPAAPLQCEPPWSQGPGRIRWCSPRLARSGRRDGAARGAGARRPGPVVLLDPGSLSVGDGVPLVLTFRNAGRVTVDATVTPPGTP